MLPHEVKGKRDFYWLCHKVLGRSITLGPGTWHKNLFWRQVYKRRNLLTTAIFQHGLRQCNPKTYAPSLPLSLSLYAFYGTSPAPIPRYFPRPFQVLYDDDEIQPMDEEQLVLEHYPGRLVGHPLAR